MHVSSGITGGNMADSRDSNRGDRVHDTTGRENREQARGGAEDRERIQRRAYERYEERGGEHGHDQEDWYEAERENRERSSE
jgi:hypothetical protein